MLVVRFQNALIINEVSFYLNMQIAGELSIYCVVWIPHHQQLITIKKKKKKNWGKAAKPSDKA